ncbi:MAG: sigma-70 family RNA polymerase sigma factor [Rudaea sp.]
MAHFDTTHWSVVLRARGDEVDARKALEALCRTYRPPVLAYVRRRGYAPDAAEDLAQTFFARFLEQAYHANADPERGRFRAFLLTALKRFLIDSDAEAAAQKRGGNFRFRSLDSSGANEDDSLNHITDGDTPERAFERSWAIALLDSAMRKLREEADKAGKAELFDQLSEFLTDRPDEADYERVAVELNMRRNTLAVAVHRLRHRLRELVRAELADTTMDAGEMQSELRELRGALNVVMR